MVLVMMSILMHMMAAGSLSGMEHGVHPITTNLGNQVSILQGFAKKKFHYQRPSDRTDRGFSAFSKNRERQEKNRDQYLAVSFAIRGQDHVPEVSDLPQGFLQPKISQQRPYDRGLVILLQTTNCSLRLTVSRYPSAHIWDLKFAGVSSRLPCLFSFITHFYFSGEIVF